MPNPAKSKRTRGKTSWGQSHLQGREEQLHFTHLSPSARWAQPSTKEIACAHRVPHGEGSDSGACTRPSVLSGRPLWGGFLSYLMPSMTGRQQSLGTVRNKGKCRTSLLLPVLLCELGRAELRFFLHRGKELMGGGEGAGLTPSISE